MSEPGKLTSKQGTAHPGALGTGEGSFYTGPDNLPYHKFEGGAPVQLGVDGTQLWRASVGRNRANTTNQWLRDANGLPLNLAPIRVPWDCTLVMLVATGNALDTWDGEVFSGAVVRAGGVPSDGAKDTEIQLAGSNSQQLVVSVAYTAGDEIGVFLRGTAIDSPRVDLYFTRNP